MADEWSCSGPRDYPKHIDIEPPLPHAPSAPIPTAYLLFSPLPRVSLPSTPPSSPSPTASPPPTPSPSLTASPPSLPHLMPLPHSLPWSPLLSLKPLPLTCSSSSMWGRRSWMKL